uniref:Uncharacterized protein n=1 Tax=Haptolina ericina TaxID=156174 RepID=A0A7S3AKL3_9EUKA
MAFLQPHTTPSDAYPVPPVVPVTEPFVAAAARVEEMAGVVERGSWWWDKVGSVAVVSAVAAMTVVAVAAAEAVVATARAAPRPCALHRLGPRHTRAVASFRNDRTCTRDGFLATAAS